MLAKIYGRKLICSLRHAKAAMAIQRHVRKSQKIKRERREKGFDKLKVGYIGKSKFIYKGYFAQACMEKIVRGG